YVISQRGDRIEKTSPAGKPLGTIPLKIGLRKPGPSEHGFNELRVFGTDALLKRPHETELFQRYNLATGAFEGVVTAELERWVVPFPGDTWTAGQPVPFQVGLITSAGEKRTPHWRVWARSLGGIDYRELALQGGTLQVPADCAGIYQIKVTPEVEPLE